MESACRPETGYGWAVVVKQASPESARLGLHTQYKLPDHCGWANRKSLMFAFIRLNSRLFAFSEKKRRSPLKVGRALLCAARRVAAIASDYGKGGSNPVKVGQTNRIWVRRNTLIEIVCNRFIINSLQNFPRMTRSRLVKPGQTDLECLAHPGISIFIALNRT